MAPETELVQYQSTMTVSAEALDEAIETIGAGRHQICVLIPGGAAYAATTAISFSISQAARAVVFSYGLPEYYIGLVGSCLFGGYAAGSFFGGWLADSVGRRRPVVCSFAGLTVLLGVVPFLANVFWVFTITVIGIGCFMGLGLAAANAGMKEWSSKKWRSRLFSALFVFLTFGQVWPAVLLMFLAPEMNPSTIPWRLLLALQAIASGCLFLFAIFFLPETAHWLREKGRFEEADAVLRLALARNGVCGGVNVFKAQQSATDNTAAKQEEDNIFWHSEQEAESISICRGRLLCITVIMCLLGFVANASYYGLIYTLPRALSKLLGSKSSSPAGLILLAAVFELPGIGLQAIAGEHLSRPINTAVVFGSMAISMSLLTYGLRNPEMASGFMPLLVMTAKTSVVASFIITYLVAAEVYPSTVSGFGVGFVMTFGRVGAVLCPVVCAASGHPLFYLELAAMATLGACSSFVLPLLRK